MYKVKQLRRLEEELAWKNEEWNKLTESEYILNELKSAMCIDNPEIIKLNQEELWLKAEKQRNRRARTELIKKITQLKCKHI